MHAQTYIIKSDSTTKYHTRWNNFWVFFSYFDLFLNVFLLLMELIICVVHSWKTWMLQNPSYFYYMSRYSITRVAHTLILRISRVGILMKIYMIWLWMLRVWDNVAIPLLFFMEICTVAPLSSTYLTKLGNGGVHFTFQKNPIFAHLGYHYGC